MHMVRVSLRVRSVTRVCWHGASRHAGVRFGARQIVAIAMSSFHTGELQPGIAPVLIPPVLAAPIRPRPIRLPQNGVAAPNGAMPYCPSLIWNDQIAPGATCLASFRPVTRRSRLRFQARTSDTVSNSRPETYERYHFNWFAMRARAPTSHGRMIPTTNLPSWPARTRRYLYAAAGISDLAGQPGLVIRPGD